MSSFYFGYGAAVSHTDRHRSTTDRHRSSHKRRQNTALHSFSLSSSYRAAAGIACSCTAQRGQNCLSQVLANIQPDCTISPRVYLRALLAVRAGSGAGPAGLPSKCIHAQPPITHDRSAGLLHASFNSPETIPVGDHMSWRCKDASAIKACPSTARSGEWPAWFFF